MRSSGYDSMLSLAWGLVWIPGQRTKILHVTWHGQKKKVAELECGHVMVGLGPSWQLSGF